MFRQSIPSPWLLSDVLKPLSDRETLSIAGVLNVIFWLSSVYSSPLTIITTSVEDRIIFVFLNE